MKDHLIQQKQEIDTIMLYLFFICIDTVTSQLFIAFSLVRTSGWRTVKCKDRLNVATMLGHVTELDAARHWTPLPPAALP